MAEDAPHFDVSWAASIENAMGIDPMLLCYEIIELPDEPEESPSSNSNDALWNTILEASADLKLAVDNGRGPLESELLVVLTLEKIKCNMIYQKQQQQCSYHESGSKLESCIQNRKMNKGHWK
uniref:Uncharacterized protein n=1 Tax=Romanomermis culicivorax TaxID=13658 RepID=A0A915HRP7_ROMCU